MANFPNLKTNGASVEINRETAFLNKMIKTLSQEGWDLRRLLAASPCGLCTPPRIQDFYNYAWFKYYFAITLNVCLSHELKGERNIANLESPITKFLEENKHINAHKQPLYRCLKSVNTCFISIDRISTLNWYNIKRQRL